MGLLALLPNAPQKISGQASPCFRRWGVIREPIVALVKLRLGSKVIVSISGARILAHDALDDPLIHEILERSVKNMQLSLFMNGHRYDARKRHKRMDKSNLAQAHGRVAVIIGGLIAGRAEREVGLLHGDIHE